MVERSDEGSGMAATKPNSESNVLQPRSPRFVGSWASILLDFLRGSAALLVLSEHWRNIFLSTIPR
jgi:hypothetical protein